MVRVLLSFAITTIMIAATQAQECSWKDVDGVAKPLDELIALYKMRKFRGGETWCPFSSGYLMYKPDDGSEIIPLYWIKCEAGEVYSVDTKMGTGPRIMPPGRFDGCRLLEKKAEPCTPFANITAGTVYPDGKIIEPISNDKIISCRPNSVIGILRNGAAMPVKLPANWMLSCIDGKWHSTKDPAVPGTIYSSQQGAQLGCVDNAPAPGSCPALKYIEPGTKPYGGVVAPIETDKTVRCPGNSVLGILQNNAQTPNKLNKAAYLECKEQVWRATVDPKPLGIPHNPEEIQVGCII